MSTAKLPKTNVVAMRSRNHGEAGKAAFGRFRLNNCFHAHCSTWTMTFERMLVARRWCGNREIPIRP